MAKTDFYETVVEAFKKAGVEKVRNNDSHDIYRGPKGNIVVPFKLDDHVVARRILKRAGIQP